MTTKELIYRRKPFNEKYADILERSILWGDSVYDDMLRDIIPGYKPGEEMTAYWRGDTDIEPHVSAKIINALPPEEALCRLMEMNEFDFTQTVDDVFNFFSAATGRTVEEIKEFFYGTPDQIYTQGKE